MVRKDYPSQEIRHALCNQCEARLSEVDSIAHEDGMQVFARIKVTFEIKEMESR